MMRSHACYCRGGTFLTGKSTGSVVACRMTSRAGAHRASLMCRYQPVALRTSYSSDSTSCLVASKPLSMHHWYRLLTL